MTITTEASRRVELSPSAVGQSAGQGHRVAPPGGGTPTPATEREPAPARRPSLLLLLLGPGCSRQAVVVIVPDQNPTPSTSDLERREDSVLSPQSSVLSSSPVLSSSSVLIRSTPPSCEEKEQPPNPSPAEEWLYRQRAYPFGEIPPKGRRDAFEAVKRQRAIQSDAAGLSYAWWSLGPAPLQTRSAWKTAPCILPEAMRVVELRVP